MATQTLYHISHITSEYADWLRAISFYKEEISILKNRLAEVSLKNSKPEVKADVEHYQNQFILQNDNLDVLAHDVHEHEKHMNADADRLAQHLSNHTLAEHDNMRERYQVLEKIITDLRHDFNKFLCRYM